MTRNYVSALKRANQLISENKWQDALEHLRIADVEYPDTSAILTAMGDCLIHLSKPDAAVSSFGRVTELEPQSIEAMNNLGVAHMFAGDFKNSESAYLKALQFKPDHIQTLKNLAFLYYQQDDRLGDAATVLAGLIRMKPDDCEALYLMGKCYEAGGDLKSATACYERVLHYDPDSTLAADALSQVNADK